ncbi:brachyurin-like isoform X2 [Cherax quadricarinatus]|uniref:brachyurin-like isoform X2 n=1 Tax=Cherax quadricarinatus TaxID=27406 RepID=UPI00387E9FF8
MFVCVRLVMVTALVLAAEMMENDPRKDSSIQLDHSAAESLHKPSPGSQSLHVLHIVARNSMADNRIQPSIIDSEKFDDHKDMFIPVVPPVNNTLNKTEDHVPLDVVNPSLTDSSEKTTGKETQISNKLSSPDSSNLKADITGRNTANTADTLSYPGCGISTVSPNRIIKGSIAAQYEFPWQALLYIQWSDKKQMCGGSFIYPQWVLTAAHCVLRKYANGSLWRPLLQVNLGVRQRNTKALVSVMAADIVIYPTYNLANDLALIKLPYAVTVSSQICPVCLPSRSMLAQSCQGKVFKIAGFGKTELGAVSNDLRKLDDRIGIDYPQCQSVFGPSITEHHFCTSGSDYKHICLGDSGGGVFLMIEGRAVVWGVVSFVATEDCSNTYPDGHISVAYFLDWIQNVTARKIY